MDTERSSDTAKPILHEMPILPKRVLVTGFFDLLNSGHVSRLKDAAKEGELHVAVGSDRLFEEMKGRKPICSEQERLYMVKALRYVKDAFVVDSFGALRSIGEQVRGIAASHSIGSGAAVPFDNAKLYCEADTAKPILRGSLQYCSSAADTEPKAPILHTELECKLPFRVDLAGTWIDQPYVSKYGAGWAITASIEPTHEFMERGGMSTSTRNAAKKIWPHELPPYNEEMLARLLFCFENDPENKGHVSGAQDAIGICISGLSRHYYDGHYWPEKIETVHEDSILDWLEQHLCIVPMFPRRPGCSVVEGKDITPEKVKALTEAASNCWDAILAKDLPAFARAFQASFEAQIALFSAMMQPGVQDHIGQWKNRALAWKMLGAGGGGHLLLVVDSIPKGSIPIKIRRR